jgi:hypothetical protein
MSMTREENKEKNINLAYKGDFFEQNAELAKAYGNQEMVQISYRRALGYYETGGWIEQALKVARILDDKPKISELEAKLK